MIYQFHKLYKNISQNETGNLAVKRKVTLKFGYILDKQRIAVV